MELRRTRSLLASYTSTKSPAQTRNASKLSSTMPLDAMRHSHSRLFEYEVAAPSVNVPVATVKSTVPSMSSQRLLVLTRRPAPVVSRTLAGTLARPSSRNWAEVVVPT